ncbi:MAG: sulfatase-like hydrolase/transferase [Solirubrobacterales bacterium]
MSTRPPSFLLLITDQQRRPRHWPDESGWLQSLMPGDAELARTGVTFDNAFCNTAMCSPSRTSLFTSRWPAEHGVELTLTAADLRPDPRNTPSVAATMARILARREAPAPRLLRQFAKGALRIGESRGHETELPSDLPNMARLLAARGYRVAYKGKWHLTHASGGEGALLGGWTEADGKRLETDYGFGEWEVPDAGENAKAEHFGGGNAAEGEGWDEVYTQQAERFLAEADPDKPFCLVVSLVNPHDVLGYPASYERGGYSLSEFRDLGVELPPTVDETLHNKPAVHALMRMGMNAYLGPLRNEREQLDYVNFYAHLHRIVDEKISRIVGALGDPDDPGSLRSRTVVVRCADHGEMGLSHGGLRQKAFNVYEETINIPMVISNPVLFPRPAGSDALVSLVDVLPTMLALAGDDGPAREEADLRGKDLTPILANRAVASRERAGISPVDLAPVLEHPQPAPSVQDAIHFTYDDHQAGTAMREAPGQPNRVRAVRTADAKYAVYLDPKGRADSEHEMYDLTRDPDETHNLVGVKDGRPLDRTAASQRAELAERLDVAMDEARTRIGTGTAT